MYNKRRIHRLKTQKIQNTSLTKPFQQSISAILIQKCDKCTQQLQKGNMKAVKDTLISIDKDMTLLHTSHTDYARLVSLACNTKAGYYRKNGQNQQALKCIDQAIAVQRSSNIDRIDMARTLLNKSVIMGQMAREDKSLYSHQTAIALAKEALQIIKNRPEGKQFVHKDQYKLGQIIIISFHNIATQLICLKNEAEGYNLYRKAYDIALRVLGQRHNLTIHLKSIIHRYREEKSQKRKVYTQQGQPSPKNSKGKIMTNSLLSRSSKKTNFVEQNKKFKNFFKIYGYSKNNSYQEETNENLDMKDLGKIQQIYKPLKTNSYFPQVKRRNIREIISQGRQLASKRSHQVSVNQKQKPLTTLKTSKNTSRPASTKKLQKLKTEQIQLPPQKNKIDEIINKKLSQTKPEPNKPEEKPIQNKPDDKDSCQLI